MTGPRSSPYADEVDASHVGRRVSIRRWVDDDGERRPSDVVGELVDADENHFVVCRRNGQRVRVDRVAVLGSRLLPVTPPGSQRH